MQGFDGSRVFLHPENASSIGDDTFWTWFKREFPNARWDWQAAGPKDVVLQYSALGQYHGPAKYIALCWELYPEMQERLPKWAGDWSAQVRKCMECAEHTPWRTVPTAATAHYYEKFGHVEIIPIGVDTGLFRPLYRPRSAGFWCGTDHYMKGADLMEAARSDDWTVVWKNSPVPQVDLNGLMNRCEFAFSTGRLKPMSLVEWEAMASGLPLVHAPGVERECPEGSSRDLVFALGWNREAARTTWANYIERVLSE